MLVAVLLMLIAAPAYAGTVDTDHDGLAGSFEIAYHLDPNNPDTDHDGLLDPAEDLDGDGMSNLAEQRFHTNPRLRDTDSDGVPDGQEDRNGNGVPDWVEQDHRPVPVHLRPALDKATADNYCYQIGSGTTGNCVGDPNGKKLVAIYGDSHSGQWIASLQVLATEHHWRLESFAKSACPSVHVDANGGIDYDQDCRAWRASSEHSMTDQPPDLVIVTNYSHYNVSPTDWRAGLAATLDALPASSKVLVLADTPETQHDVPHCLNHHPDDIGSCETPRSQVYVAGHDDLERKVAQAHGATFASMNAWICPTRLCPAVVGHFLVWRDYHHLTVAYAKQLSPALDAIVIAALQ